MLIFKPPHSAETTAALIMLRAMGWALQYCDTRKLWRNKIFDPDTFFDSCEYRAIPPGEKADDR